MRQVLVEPRLEQRIPARVTGERPLSAHVDTVKKRATHAGERHVDAFVVARPTDMVGVDEIEAVFRAELDVDVGCSDALDHPAERIRRRIAEHPHPQPDRHGCGRRLRHHLPRYLRHGLGSWPRANHDGEARHREGSGNDDARPTEGQAVTPDGLLEKAVRKRGDAERHGRAERVKREAVNAGALGREDEIHRPVPEVRAVAHHPERAQRRNGQQPSNEALGPRNRTRDQHERRELGEPEATSVEQKIATVDRRPGPAERREREDAGRVEKARGRATLHGRARGDARERGAGEDRGRARVGAEVDAHRPLGVEERDHREHRQKCETDRRRKQRSHAEAPEHENDDQRPDDVELLLDREAPGVLERRRRQEELPVALVREDRAPVRDVSERRERVGSDAGELRRAREEDA